jgi:hypothetical protein
VSGLRLLEFIEIDANQFLSSVHSSEALQDECTDGQVDYSCALATDGLETAHCHSVQGLIKMKSILLLLEQSAIESGDVRV